MGHKLSTALILLNAMGILACVILISAANNHAPDVAIRLSHNPTLNSNVHRWSRTSVGRMGNC